MQQQQQRGAWHCLRVGMLRMLLLLRLLLGWWGLVALAAASREEGRRRQVVEVVVEEVVVEMATSSSSGLRRRFCSRTAGTGRGGSRRQHRKGFGTLDFTTAHSRQPQRSSKIVLNRAADVGCDVGVMVAAAAWLCVTLLLTA